MWVRATKQKNDLKSDLHFIYVIFLAHHEAGHAVAGWNLEYADPLLKVCMFLSRLWRGHACRICLAYCFQSQATHGISCSLSVLYILGHSGHNCPSQFWRPRIRPVPSQGDFPADERPDPGHGVYGPGGASSRAGGLYSL